MLWKRPFAGMRSATLVVIPNVGVSIPPDRAGTSRVMTRTSSQGAKGGHTMADRSLRGMRLGSQSLQSEEGVEFSPRKKSRVPHGRRHDLRGHLRRRRRDPRARGSRPGPARRAASSATTASSSRPRRSRPRLPAPTGTCCSSAARRAELEELLQERLDFLRARRGEAAKNSQERLTSTASTASR